MKKLEKDWKKSRKSKSDMMIKTIVIFIIATLSLMLIQNCKTIEPKGNEQSPIFIYEIPEIDLDETADIYNDYESLTKWTVEIVGYVKNLINQIETKVSYIKIDVSDDTP